MCFPTHSLNEGQTLTFGTSGEAKYFPHGTEPHTMRPQLWLLLASNHSPFPCVWSSQQETKPRAGDVPSLSSLTPSHTPFPLFSTLGNHPNTIGDDYSVTLMIKGSYGQENLISQAIQPKSLDGKTGVQTNASTMQDF